MCFATGKANFGKSRIKILLYDEGFTIAGARRRIAEEQKMKDAGDRTNELLKEIRHELIAIREMIGPCK
jgi:hypothetical protein